MRIPKKLKRIIRKVFIAAAVFAVGAAAFYCFRPEGEFTPYANDMIDVDDSDNLSVNVVTWNVLCGQESGVKANNWADRKKSFQSILKNRKIDILCLQEARIGQVNYFGSILTGFSYAAVGREDGKQAGEHCAIFYDENKFALKEEGTFWLSKTPEKPSKDWREMFPRICTWVLLADKESGVIFCVYNVHMPLVSYARHKSAELILQRVNSTELPCIIAGDLNDTPRSKTIKMFTEAGFASADSRGALTQHVRGKGIRCLDYILHDNAWTVVDGAIIREKEGEVYPSDHFGVSATLVIPKSLSGVE